MTERPEMNGIGDEFCVHMNYKRTCAECGKERESVAETPLTALRGDLLKKRIPAFEDHGETQVITVEAEDGRRFTLTPPFSDYESWLMTEFDKEGRYVDTTSVASSEDRTFLDQLRDSGESFGSDIKAALRDSHKVFTTDYGEKKVISTEFAGKTFQFMRADNEYADWQAVVLDKNGEYLTSLDVRGAVDVKFLEELFEKTELPTEQDPE